MYNRNTTYAVNTLPSTAPAPLYPAPYMLLQHNITLQVQGHNATALLIINFVVYFVVKNSCCSTK